MHCKQNSKESVPNTQQSLLQNTSTGNFIFTNVFDHYSLQYLNLSNELNLQLMKNNELIQKKFTIEEERNQKKSLQNNSTNNGTSVSNYNSSQSSYYFQTNKQVNQITQVKVPASEKKKPKKYKKQSQESYEPSCEEMYEVQQAKICQSKNIPKNYGKAILNFIQRNEQYADKVLQFLNITKEDFLQDLKRLRNHLNTIFELRSMWIENSNQFAKAYRIFSMEYLRKHSLGYIFNSRIENINKHIKYRYKIMESVSQPEHFTCMKEF